MTGRPYDDDDPTIGHVTVSRWVPHENYIHRRVKWLADSLPTPTINAPASVSRSDRGVRLLPRQQKQSFPNSENFQDM
ncbi:3-dehydroquinate synthase [Anopheles sinensis]|uniref:3-dehydroquinate synthase n=1 Tax=Anopheles sinensis TaxID=74873 RepID=A0A084W807_ANOSI|nr:3-dehydroquinate synthase [Anopheles sinensis]